MEDESPDGGVRVALAELSDGEKLQLMLKECGTYAKGRKHEDVAVRKMVAAQWRGRLEETR